MTELLPRRIVGRRARSGGPLPSRTPHPRPVGVAAALVMVVTGCLGQLTGVGSTVAAADQGSRRPPVPGALVRAFRIGEHDWDPGHRGIDLRGSPGEPVRAAADGEISWVGVIAGVPMLTVQHPDGLRSTYQPVTATLPVGQQVRVGDQVGVLVAGHCADGACLHFGVRDQDRYLDPVSWLGGTGSNEVRLLPRSASPRQLPPPGSTETADVEYGPVSSLPADGPLTSPFGYRVNPISGLGELHDGIDIGAPCGAPVRPLWPGRVTFAGAAGGFGQRVEIDHGVVDGAVRTTSYSHLSQINVGVGQQVGAGATVGLVGTTGFSTGCHLHYSMRLDDRLVDPLGGAG